MLQQVTEDGYTFVGPAIEILANIPSDGAGVEAPTLFYDTTSGLYVLLFNSGCFTSTDYSILYATAPTVTGPYTRRGVLFATGQPREIYNCLEGSTCWGVWMEVGESGRSYKGI